MEARDLPSQRPTTSVVAMSAFRFVVVPRLASLLKNQSKIKRKNQLVSLFSFDDWKDCLRTTFENKMYPLILIRVIPVMFQLQRVFHLQKLCVSLYQFSQGNLVFFVLPDE